MGISTGWAISGAIVILLYLVYLWKTHKSGMLDWKKMRFGKKSGFYGCCPPRAGNMDGPGEELPSLNVVERCPKCKHPNLSGKTCPNCESCSECRAEDKCGVCQQFQRQVSLSERRRPCPVCDRKPCMCVSATGKVVTREPGVVRNGVFADPVVSEL